MSTETIAVGLLSVLPLACVEIVEIAQPGSYVNSVSSGRFRECLVVAHSTAIASGQMVLGEDGGGAGMMRPRSGDGHLRSKARTAAGRAAAQESSKAIAYASQSVERLMRFPIVVG